MGGNQVVVWLLGFLFLALIIPINVDAAEFTGGGQRSDVDAFLSYTFPTQKSSIVTSQFNIIIDYGPIIVDADHPFTQTLNRDPITKFNPVPNTSETVTFNLPPGKYVLKLIIEGTNDAGRISTDRDRLVFTILDTIDSDGDGFFADVDCDDSDAAIHPGAVDIPDSSFVDSNCDGIDGDESRAIFVSSSGSDSNPGTKAQPVKTIGFGLVKADNVGRDHAYVSTGTYNGKVTLINGISMWGGYDTFWNRGASKAIISSSDFLSGHVVGVVGTDILTSTTVSDFDIRTVDTNSASASNYGLNCLRCNGLIFAFNIISAGDAGPGSNGASGQNGDLGGNGANGVAGRCDTGGGGFGGIGGSSPVSRNGGTGGRGGAESGPGNAQSGFSGTGPTGGGGGFGGSGGTTGRDGGDGQPGGDGPDGSNGAGGSTGTIVSSRLWVSNSGNQGTNGDHGSGGGGGGGGGGQDGFFVNDGRGNGGGGGGGAGETGTGSIGGTGGGGSFGLFLADSSGIQIFSNSISSSNGGNGGVGGTGGLGGSGGSGGNGATFCSNEIGEGGDGGAGGRGGHGGHGGGGAGGPSYAVFTSNTATGLLNILNSLSHGNGGTGGSSPGNVGQNGASDDVN